MRYLKSCGLRLVESRLSRALTSAAVGLCEIHRALGVEYGKSGGVLAPLGGGDLRLAMDFVEFISGGTPSISCTQISDSINGHLVVFAADESLAHKTRYFYNDGKFEAR